MEARGLIVASTCSLVSSFVCNTPHVVGCARGESSHGLVMTLDQGQHQGEGWGVSRMIKASICIIARACFVGVFSLGNKESAGAFLGGNQTNGLGPVEKETFWKTLIMSSRDRAFR